MDPYAGITKEGKLYGRGSTDMKASIVAMIEATVAIIRSGVELKDGLMNTLTCDEEVDNISTGHLVESKTDEKCGKRHRGRGNFQ